MQVAEEDAWQVAVAAEAEEANLQRSVFVGAFVLYTLWIIEFLYLHHDLSLIYTGILVFIWFSLVSVSRFLVFVSCLLKSSLCFNLNQFNLVANMNIIWKRYMPIFFVTCILVKYNTKHSSNTYAVAISYEKVYCLHMYT